MTTQENAFAMSLPLTFVQACKMTAPFDLRATNRISGETQAYTIGQPFAFLGRAHPMGVRLDDPSVSQCHAYLQVIEGIPYCIDLGSRTGVVWDDGSKNRGWVYTNHKLRIGVFDVQIGAAHSVGEEPSEPIENKLSRDEGLPQVAIEIHGIRGNAHDHRLDRPITLIGRHPSCHLRFVDDAISYFHCALVNTSDGIWCLDIMTKKGTLINGRRARLARLRDGDLLELGKTSLVIRSEPKVAAPLVLNESATGLETIDPEEKLTHRVAESMTSAFAPLREVMDQFQNCFMTMAQMFTTMQQEHSATVCEQMRLMQELLKEVRELRSGEGRSNSTKGHLTAPPEVPLPVTPAPRLPTPKVSESHEAKALTDAHTWFMDRLTQMDQASTTKPK